MRATFRAVLLPCVVVFALTSVAARAQQLWALRGTVVTPTGPVAGATVLIDGTTIRAVGTDVVLPPNTPLIETGGFIYPGLIDLHNHVTWNVLPHWSAGVLLGSRYDWQQLMSYHMALSLPHEKLIDEGHGCAAERYAEVKALVGGATAQAGLSPEDVSTRSSPTAPATLAPQCLGNHIRELGVSTHLYPPGTPEPLRSEIFPLVLDPAPAAALISGLQQHTIQATLVHIAEGGATDANARKEFSFFESRGLLVPGVSIIHGVALTSSNFTAMAKASVGLIWSPRSNLELYGSTTDVASAKKAGVTLAIAPDWSPTGSDGMLQELKYAALWNALQSPSPFTDRDLFQMATQNAASLAGIADQTGSIAPGKRADLLVLSSTAAPPISIRADPYDALVHASLAQVALVVVEGVPQYGDARPMHQINPRGKTDPVTVCGTTKEVTSTAPQSWAATQAELTAALNRWGTTLAPLTDCR